jgi:hypothetical protein
LDSTSATEATIERAAHLLETVVIAPELAEFITLEAYLELE